MIISAVQGFAVTAGLIVAIGAQNAFVLSQGIKQEHWLIIPLICWLCDALLISLGVSGMGAAAATHPVLADLSAWCGALFLAVYGWRALRSALRSNTLTPVDRPPMSLWTAVATTLALTLFNPHVYIDTILLIGGIGSRFTGLERSAFTLGAITASLTWFLLLSLGGRLLAPVFQRPAAWRVLDTLICLTMWAIALSLIA